MKIAPERGRDPLPADQQQRVTSFVTSLGVALPAPYQEFLVRFDGGAPYPNIFNDARPAEVRGFPDNQAFCDRLYDLSRVMELQAGDSYGDGIPSGFILIGEDPGGLEIMLSLRSQDFGAIYVWQGTADRWASETNNETLIAKQADSFVAFLNSLYDTPDRIGLDQWETPLRKETAVSLDLR